MPTAKIDGINMAYDVSGHGEPLVMIMGLGGTRQSWVFQKRTFSKHFKVITFDSRGMGKSDKPSETFTIRTMADDTIGLMNHLNIDKAHVLGVSHGGRVAQEVAINYPERVNKLVLASTNTGAEGIDDLPPEVLGAFGRKERTGQSDIIYAGMKQCSICQEDHQGKELWEHMWAAHRPQMLEWAKQSIDFSKIISLGFNKRLYRMLILPLARLQLKLGGIEAHIRLIEATVGNTTLDRLHLIKAPTLVILGTEDKFCPPRSIEAMATRIPHARLVKIDGGSHNILVEMKGRFNKEVLDFLRFRQGG
jgi:pimeloyl-ACP methyl ester carboxylesterase